MSSKDKCVNMTTPMYAWADTQDHTHSCDTHTHTRRDVSKRWCLFLRSHTLRDRDPPSLIISGEKALQACRFLFPILLLLALSAVVNNWVKHLHFLTVHKKIRQCKTLLQKSRVLYPAVVYCDPAASVGKPQHTCLLFCINTVIHIGVYTHRMRFYRSGHGTVFWGNATQVWLVSI